jgi:hypothetical protein
VLEERFAKKKSKDTTNATKPEKSPREATRITITSLNNTFSKRVPQKPSQKTPRSAVDEPRA